MSFVWLLGIPKNLLEYSLEYMSPAKKTNVQNQTLYQKKDFFTKVYLKFIAYEISSFQEFIIFQLGKVPNKKTSQKAKS